MYIFYNCNFSLRNIIQDQRNNIEFINFLYIFLRRINCIKNIKDNIHQIES